MPHPIEKEEIVELWERYLEYAGRYERELSFVGFMNWLKDKEPQY